MDKKHTLLGFFKKIKHYFFPNPEKYIFHLGIKNIPLRLAKLYTGRIYGLIATQSAILNSCIFRTLIHDHEHNAVLVSKMSAQDMLETINMHGFNPQKSHQKDRLFLFEAAADLRTQIQVLGLESFLDQLDQYRVSPGSLIMISQAEMLFQIDDRTLLKRQGELLKEWCETRQHCVFLVFSPQAWDENKAKAQNGIKFTLRSLRNFMAGLTRMIEQSGNFIWRFEFWQTQANLLGSQSYDLQVLPSGELMAIDPNASDQALSLAPDENRVVISAKAVARERSVPDAWQVVSNNDAVLDACRNAIAVTAVLSFDGNHAMVDLARVVHQLRQICGNTIKIVVREGRESMRHQHDRLILDLGVNLIVGKGVPMSNMLAMIHNLQGQLFCKPLVEDFNAALGMVSAPSVVGYVPVADFVKSTQETIERSQNLQVPNVLIKLALRPQITPAQAVLACSNLKRLGDFCTLAENWVYIFLFECREVDVDIVKRRVFSDSAGQFFDAEFRFVEPDDILHEIDQITSFAKKHTPTDYSATILQNEAKVAAKLLSDKASALHGEIKSAVAESTDLPFLNPAANENEVPAAAVSAWTVPLKKK